MEIVAIQIVKLSREFQVEKRPKKAWISIMPKIDNGISWDFFDGAS
jgi:hypothetical protein